VRVIFAHEIAANSGMVHAWWHDGSAWSVLPCLSPVVSWTSVTGHNFVMIDVYLALFVAGRNGFSSSMESCSGDSDVGHITHQGILASCDESFCRDRMKWFSSSDFF
jgi:hypothetical protein